MAWRKSPPELVDVFERVVPRGQGIERRKIPDARRMAGGRDPLRPVTPAEAAEDGSAGQPEEETMNAMDVYRALPFRSREDSRERSRR
jgi:hypothetical protein